jgi:hypothetical protein
MDFGFICASSDNYRCPSTRSDRIINSYDGYNSYLLIVDNKLSMTWVFLTKSKSPPLEIASSFEHSDMTKMLEDSSSATKAGNLPDLIHSLIWCLQSSATRWSLPAPTARPRTDKQRSETIPLLSLLGHSYTGWLWNPNIGRRLSCMRSTFTTVGYTLKLVPPPSKAGGASNLT